MHEVLEALLVDQDDLAVGDRCRGRAARRAVDQRHLTEDSAPADLLELVVAGVEQDFTSRTT